MVTAGSLAGFFLHKINLNLITEQNQKILPKGVCYITIKVVKITVT